MSDFDAMRQTTSVAITSAFTVPPPLFGSPTDTRAYRIRFAFVRSLITPQTPDYVLENLANWLALSVGDPSGDAIWTTAVARSTILGAPRARS